MKKENSTNTLNRKRLDAVCGSAYTLSLIGGRWKPSILCCLMGGKMRYNELRRSMPGASERILVLQLRELEKDGLVKRIVYAEVPPRVEYELTDAGLSMKSMLKSISEWGLKYRPQE
jgi:DNA-binding HxlR family transcriptional regulator